MVAWWKGENNFLDSVGANDAIPENGVGFGPGEFGTAFNLSSGQFMVANSATPSSLDVGQGPGLTFEEWINPTTVTAEEMLFEYERILGSGSGSDSGIGFAIHADSGGILYANLVDTNSISHEIESPSGLLVPGVWQHVALTYDKASGTGAIYINGVAVTVLNLGSFTTITSFTNLLLGARTLFASVGSPASQYSGEMDEISLYSRALSASEIQTIYQNGSAGKCYTPTAPFITTQPTNQAVELGGTAHFVVVAGGTPPLAYQWIFDGTNIANATNASLTLSSVQLTNAGNYSVMITNVYGSTNSSTAILDLTTNSICETAGIVAWWKGENNFLDSVGDNDATPENGVGFGPGEGRNRLQPQQWPIYGCQFSDFLKPGCWSGAWPYI